MGEPERGLCRAFNYKLGHIATQHNKRMVCIQPLLELKTLNRSCPYRVLIRLGDKFLLWIYSQVYFSAMANDKEKSFNTLTPDGEIYANCLVMEGENGYWRDYACPSQLSYNFCEKQITKPITPPIIESMS